MAMLYALDLTGLLDGRWRQALPLLSAPRRERALRCRLDADSARLTGAGLLLHGALCRAGIPPAQQLLRRSPWGKPELADGRCHVSLSHSGRWAACAVDKAPVGVDVESARCTMAIARRYFHPEELTFLASLPEIGQPEALARLWTGKEAFAKAVGRGLQTGLSRFCIHPDGTVMQPFLPRDYRIDWYQIGGMTLALASAGCRPDVEQLSLRQLYDLVEPMAQSDGRNG